MKKIWRCSGIFLLVVLFLAGCGQREPEVLYIGVLAPLSGDAAPTGNDMVNAAQFAVDEINQQGLEINGRSYKLVLVIEDDEANPETAVSATQELINQKNVVAIVGPPFSSAAIPAAEVAEAAGIPLLSPTSTNPKTTQNKQYVFRATFIDDFQIQALVRFTQEDLHATKAAVLFDITNPYNQGLAESFQRAFTAIGGQVVAFESYTADQNEDFTQQLAAIKESSPDVLFLPNATNEVRQQAEQARMMGITATIIGSDIWEAERLVDSPAFENSFFSGHYCRDLSISRIRTFTEKYEQAYGRVPNGLIALTYDSFGLLVAAMKYEKDVTPEAIRNGLYNNEGFVGITGPINYADNGDPIKSVAIWQIRDGDRACIKMITP
ncbi:MAG: ethanolamine utilization protein EutJ [Chloroflexi bacterium]|nr:MAG: ethanolamine utilization protein EutJ [Chloroflexota bacterium]